MVPLWPSPGWVPNLCGPSSLLPTGCPGLAALVAVLVVWGCCLGHIHPAGASRGGTVESPPCWVPWNQLGKVYDTFWLHHCLGGLGGASLKVWFTWTWPLGVILLGTLVPHGSWLLGDFLFKASVSWDGLCPNKSKKKEWCQWFPQIG